MIWLTGRWLVCLLFLSIDPGRDRLLNEDGHPRCLGYTNLHDSFNSLAGANNMSEDLEHWVLKVYSSYPQCLFLLIHQRLSRHEPLSFHHQHLHLESCWRNGGIHNQYLSRVCDHYWDRKEVPPTVAMRNEYGGRARVLRLVS